ncbi:histidine kinase dimerization/phospho-acceptor domain-containing protein [Paracidovorax avenae]|uniref:histidine kinase dimerization/phospho-acceptor domain-containing protein n=1 Tax=Paracidovorax avenae TaxID=80867 RepID=UPI000D170FFF|nr:histidine kinase dimerization/phospho-acceptor domain-containing protein [Paracidovorax avenae]AVS90054.1 two-component sensor histidine kinase [Paracidovorax avenae]AVT07613.1 two-component sensor histidine kinase [Paracidovorax avenae]
MAAATLASAHIPSLTRRLLLWTLGVLLVVWATFVGMAYLTGIEEADELTDGHLASVAALLLNLRPGETVTPEEATRRAPTPWLRAHDYQQSLNVVQWDASGHLLSHSGDAPLPPFDVPEGFATLHLGKQSTPWRSFSQWDGTRSRKVAVLLDLEERDDLAEDIAAQMVQPGLWLLPVVMLVLGFAVRRGLRPLYTLSEDVAALDVAGAGRLPTGGTLREFESVVASINTLLDRQQAALVRERRLANEVAHELRTPLSSIVLQARALDGGLEGPAQAEALARIGQDALRAGHVLNQLLALARASRTRLHELEAEVDLAELARSVAADYAQAAWQHGSALGVAADGPVAVRGNAVLLEMAVRNLVENALRHTPAGTRVEIQAGSAVGGGAWLQVCDDGRRALPGGPEGPAVRAPVDSLHLGHEIIVRVAEAHGGRFGEEPAPAPFTTCYRVELRTAPGTGTPG